MSVHDQDEPANVARQARETRIRKLAISDRESDRRQALQEILSDTSHHYAINEIIASRLIASGLLPAEVAGDFDEITCHARFSAVWEKVIETVYSADYIAGALQEFDAELGSLSAWLLCRVHLRVSDWLSSFREQRHRPVVAGTVETETTIDASQEKDLSSFEAALGELTPTQRACQVLKLFPLRELSSEDWDVIVAEGNRNGQADDTTRRLVDSLNNRSACSEDASQRFLELSAAVNRAFTRQQQRLVEWRYRREQAFDAGTSDCELIDLQKRGEKDSEEKIQARYPDNAVYVRQSRGDRLVRDPRLYSQYKFELWSRKLAWAEHTLHTAREEFKAFAGYELSQPARSGLTTETAACFLPTGDEIGACLNKTRGSVDSALNKARDSLRAAGFGPPGTSEAESKNGTDCGDS